MPPTSNLMFLTSPFRFFLDFCFIYTSVLYSLTFYNYYSLDSDVFSMLFNWLNFTLLMVAFDHNKDLMICRCNSRTFQFQQLVAFAYLATAKTQFWRQKVHIWDHFYSIHTSLNSCGLLCGSLLGKGKPTPAKLWVTLQRNYMLTTIDTFFHSRESIVVSLTYSK